MSKLAIIGGDPVREAPFHGWPIYGVEEEENLLRTLKTNKWQVGKRTGIINEFEEAFAAYHEASVAVACTNCTQALEIALSVSGVKAFDEVIVPAYTFIATASAVAKIGAVPVFADINPDTLLIDPASIEKLITTKTKAIVPVHFAGQMADLKRISDIATKYGLVLVEDAAQAHGAKRSGRYPGFCGPATFSFQYSKNMTAGEGGIIISKDSSFIEKCWEYIWHGRKKGGLWFEHFETTSNYRITEWSAAVLLAQLGRLSDQNKRRAENAAYLSEDLRKDGFLLPCAVDDEIEVHARHLFPMRINRDVFDDVSKERLVGVLSSEGMPIVSGYMFPLYKNPAFQKGRWGIRGLDYSSTYTEINLPQTEKVCLDVVWIVHNVLLGTKEDMDDIVKGIRKVAEHVDEL